MIYIQKIHPTHHDKTFSASWNKQTNKKVLYQDLRKQVGKSFFHPNLVTQIDRSFQQSGIPIYQNNLVELLFIALVFHIEMYLLGLKVFLKNAYSSSFHCEEQLIFEWRFVLQVFLTYF